MCLIINRRETETLQGKTGTVSMLKTLARRGSGLLSPWNPEFKWVPGENFALGAGEYGTNFVLSGAIHCHQTGRHVKSMEETVLGFAETEQYDAVVTVQVTADWKDFVAVGYVDDICFRKVTLSQEEYNRAVTQS